MIFGGFHAFRQQGTQTSFVSDCCPICSLPYRTALFLVCGVSVDCAVGVSTRGKVPKVSYVTTCYHEWNPAAFNATDAGMSTARVILETKITGLATSSTRLGRSLAAIVCFLPLDYRRRNRVSISYIQSISIQISILASPDYRYSKPGVSEFRV